MQPVAPTVAACGTYGCRLWHLRLPPVAPMVAACGTYGCRPTVSSSRTRPPVCARRKQPRWRLSVSWAADTRRRDTYLLSDYLPTPYWYLVYLLVVPTYHRCPLPTGSYSTYFRELLVIPTGCRRLGGTAITSAPSVRLSRTRTPNYSSTSRESRPISYGCQLGSCASGVCRSARGCE